MIKNMILGTQATTVSTTKMKDERKNWHIFS